MKKTVQMESFRIYSERDNINLSGKEDFRIINERDSIFLSGITLSKSNPNFQDITQNVKENEMLHEIFPRYILCYTAENRFPLGTV